MNVIFIFVTYLLTGFQLLCSQSGYVLPAMPNLGKITGVSKTQVQDRFKRNERGQQLANAQTKYNLPPAANIGTNRNFTSFVRNQTEMQHPAAGALFPDDQTLSMLLESFLSGCQKESYFLAFFAKIHLTILHELYRYLTSVYATISMTHIDKMEQYVTSEEKYALNKKILIVTHLISIIEAQSNQAIRARFPALPQRIATYAGTLMMKHDYGSDLSLMLEKSESQLFTSQQAQAMIADTRSTYLDLYAAYLKFFNAYTAGIEKPIIKNGLARGTLFSDHAQRVESIITQSTPTVGQHNDVAKKITVLRSMKKINPPIFLYDQESLRAIQLIPWLANQFPAGVQAFGWPEQLTKDAISGTVARSEFGNPLGYQIAYFVDSAGQKTRDQKNAHRLYMHIPTAQALYAQELIPQPAWLNTRTGILKMVRACLGDFSQILDPEFGNDDILDPCIECITRNAAARAGLGSHSEISCRACQTFISTIQAEIARKEESVSLSETSSKNQDSDDTVPPIPDDGGGV